jgi:hypothetical protein
MSGRMIDGDVINFNGLILVLESEGQREYSRRQ